MAKTKAGCSSGIGILGGTFDPPHYGHLLIAEQIRIMYKLKKIVFVPNGKPPHKSEEYVSEPRHRFMMTVMATLDNRGFEVSYLEVASKKPSYTVDLLERIRNENKEDLFFIIGSDALYDIQAWKEPERLMQLCKMIAVERPGYPLSGLNRKLGELYERNKDRLIAANVYTVNLSASDIRQRVQKNQPIRYMVPELVLDYIKKEDLYKNESKEDG